MTIHLLRAADYEPDAYFDVCSLLTSLALPGWSFIVPEVEIDPEDIYPNWGGGRRRIEDVCFRYRSPVEQLTYNYELDVPLSWRELFDICRYYRRTNDVASQDIVVLLTRRPNALNWFSSFDKEQNVFIHTADWEKFIPCDSKYPIAYQVLSNALQLQMARNIAHKEDCMHEQTIGCMNDLCEHKSQIAIKLRTADICETCLIHLKMAEVPDVLVAGALQGFDQLRRQMLFRQGFHRVAGPGPILIDKHYRILFPEQGNLELKLPSCLSRLVYVFFLHHPEGVRLSELTDHRDELIALYERMSGSGSRQTMQQRIDRLVNPLENSLHENLSRVRKALNNTLGETLSKSYQITGNAGDIHQIILSQSLIKFSDQLTPIL